MRTISFLPALVAASSLLSFPHAADAKPPRTITLSVTKNGFEPTPVKVKKGEPLTLVITRTVDGTCAKEIVVPGYGIDEELPLNKPVTVSLTPRKTGQLKYGCAMDQMIGGVLFVE